MLCLEVQVNTLQTDSPHHSVCCPLNRTIIMKTVILAVLLLLAVVSIVSGAPAESGEVSSDTQLAPIVSGDEPGTLVISRAELQSGKSRYGGETCLPVILLALQIYKFVSSSCTRGKSVGSVVVVVSKLPARSPPYRDSITTMIERR
jgi:hypothetical protein